METSPRNSSGNSRNVCEWKTKRIRMRKIAKKLNEKLTCHEKLKIKIFSQRLKTPFLTAHYRSWWGCKFAWVWENIKIGAIVKNTVRTLDTDNLIIFFSHSNNGFFFSISLQCIYFASSNRNNKIQCWQQKNTLFFIAKCFAKKSSRYIFFFLIN